MDLSKLEMAALWRYWRHFNLVNSFELTVRLLSPIKDSFGTVCVPVVLTSSNGSVGGCGPKPIKRAASRRCSEAFHVAGISKLLIAYSFVFDSNRSNIP